MKILAGLPTYSGARWNARVVATLHKSSQCHGVIEISTSLLTQAFNHCWAEALAARARGVTHFLLVHDDVVPDQPTWLTTLTGEAARVGAEVLAVAIPLKGESGLTSTARETDDPWHPRRLTLTEILAEPPTWTRDDLLVNTGLLLADIRRPWAEQVCFHMRDQIRQRADGRWVAETIPEDWDFSRQLRALGVAPWVTRSVVVSHLGTRAWRNDAAYGAATDPKVGTWQ